MSRPPLPVGTAGSVSVKEVTPGRHRALCQFRDFDGRTRQLESWGVTPTAARRALSVKVRDRGTPSGNDITAETTLAKLGELLFAEWSEGGKLRPQSIDIYRSAWRIVEPAVGQLRVREATPSAVDRFLRTVASTRPGRVRHVKVVLGAALELAVRRDAVRTNPVRQSFPIPTVHREVKAVDVATLHAVRQALADHLAKPTVAGRASPATGDVLELVIATGARTSEILALRYTDVDLAARPPTVSITGTIVAKVGEGLLRQPVPKSRSGVRALPLPPFAVEVLARRVADAADHRPTDGIFLTKNGTWMSQQNVNRAWRVARADAGLTWVTFRGCRKTVATLLARAVDDQAAADQLGHGSVRISKDHYIERARVAPDRSGALDALGPRIVSPGFPLD